LLRRTDERALRTLVAAKNDRTDAEYAQSLAQRTGRHASRRTINRTWQRLGFTRKKKVLHATERDRPEVRRARRAFRRRAQRRRGRRHIFIDEFGAHLGLTRRYARAPRGRRAVGKVPANPDPNVTLTMGLSRGGPIAPFAFEGSTDGAAYEAYVRGQLVPRLRRGDVVIADRLSAHRSRGARDAIEARGATYDLLPPYSPDLTPVEEAGGKVKDHLRAADPRDVPALYAAMGQGVAAITRRDARGYFAHRASYLSGSTKPTGPPL
jgi:transposase